MAKKTSKKGDPRSRREELLERIWEAQAEKLALILEQTPPGELQAAMLNVSRQFLGDNGVSLESLGKTYEQQEHTRRIVEAVRDAQKHAREAEHEGPLSEPMGELPVPQWGDAKLPKKE